MALSDILRNVAPRVEQATAGLAATVGRDPRALEAMLARRAQQRQQEQDLFTRSLQTSEEARRQAEAQSQMEHRNFQTGVEARNLDISSALQRQPRLVTAPTGTEDVSGVEKPPVETPFTETLPPELKAAINRPVAPVTGLESREQPLPPAHIRSVAIPESAGGGEIPAYEETRGVMDLIRQAAAQKRLENQIVVPGLGPVDARAAAAASRLKVAEENRNRPHAITSADQSQVSFVNPNEPNLPPRVIPTGLVPKPEKLDTPAQQLYEEFITRKGLMPMAGGKTKQYSPDRAGFANYEDDRATGKTQTNINIKTAAAEGAASRVDPNTVSYWVKQVQSDAKNWGLIPDKATKSAVSTELAKQGVAPNQLDAQTRDASRYAKAALSHLDKINGLVDSLEKSNQLGPILGRWNDFLVHGVGAGAPPAYTELRNNVGLLDTAMGRVHGGARGGGSQVMLEHFKNMLSAKQMDANTLRAGLRTFKDWLTTYAAMGDAGGDERTHGAGSPIEITLPSGAKVKF